MAPKKVPVARKRRPGSLMAPTTASERAIINNITGNAPSSAKTSSVTVTATPVSSTVASTAINGGSGKKITMSARLAGKRIIDNDTRAKRRRRELDALETDNFHDDPNPALDDYLGLTVQDDDMAFHRDNGSRAAKASSKSMARRMNYNIAIDDSAIALELKSIPTFLTVSAPPSKLPARSLCAVCGFFANYTCAVCGAKFCSVRCNGIHTDTRCLKFRS